MCFWNKQKFHSIILFWNIQNLLQFILNTWVLQKQIIEWQVLMINVSMPLDYIKFSVTEKFADIQTGEITSLLYTCHEFAIILRNSWICLFTALKPLENCFLTVYLCMNNMKSLDFFFDISIKESDTFWCNPKYT